MHGVGEIHVGELNAARRETLNRAGKFNCYDPSDDAEPEESSIDLVIDAVGAASTRAAASRIVKPGGTIVHAGLIPGNEGLDVRKITLQEVIFTGTYCYTRRDFVEVVDALALGRLGTLEWFEERSLADGAAAFADLDKGSTAAAKIVLRP
jgi:L-iditol 2-dehydrogenase